jgi:hypothetical protein
LPTDVFVGRKMRMNHVELKNAAIHWLVAQSTIYKGRPHAFTPKEVAEAIGGAYTALGSVADEVSAELVRRGISIRYKRVGNRRYFELQ